MQNIGETVKILGYEERDPGTFRHHLQTPAHTELRGYSAEFALKPVQIETVQAPFDAHEEQPGLMVLMLVRMGDVRAVPVKKARDGRYQPLLVRTVDE